MTTVHKALISDDIQLVKKFIAKQFDEIPLNHRSLYMQYFLTNGKMIRPTTNILIAKTINYKLYNKNNISLEQVNIAAYTEMIHTASLIHDDIIDNSIIRRKNQSLGLQYGFLPATMAGNYIMGAAAYSLAQLKNPDIINYLTQVILDLVEGELGQLKNSYQPSKATLKNYIHTCYAKTASLFANSFKATAYVSCSKDIHLHHYAYNFGKYFGIAFQLIDDILDYNSCVEQLGKPVGSDIKLGLYTAPLIYAAKQYKEIHEMLNNLNKLTLHNAQEHADAISSQLKSITELVLKSDGINQTKIIAKDFIDKALVNLKNIGNNQFSDMLTALSLDMIDRTF